MEDLGSIKRSVMVIAIIATLTVLYIARDMFLPIAAAMLIALTFSPLVRGLSRAGVPAPISAFVLISGATMILIVGIYLISGPLTDLLSNAPEMGAQLRRKLAGLLEAMRVIKEASAQVEELSASGDTATTVAIQQPGLIVFAAGTTATIISLAMVSLVLGFFLLASGDLFYIKLVESVPTFSDKRRAVGIVRDVERQMSQYLLTVTLINAALGLCLGIAMFAVGMPNPILWGALGFALNFVPFIGAIVGVAAVAAVGVLTFNPLIAGLLPAALYMIITAIEGHFITPSIVGRRMELNTVSVLLALIVWSWLWSIPGALMAVPFLVLLKVIANNTVGMQAFGNFLGTHVPREKLAA